MAKIGYINSETFNKEQFNNDNWFTYEWVLEELSKDYDIEGIDRIGFTDDGYEVFVVTDDYKLSNIPHFHYRKKENGKPCEFHTCIRFDKAEYYHHIGNEDVLNDKQKEELVKFLTTKCENNSWTHWQLAIMKWNHQNDYKLEIDYDLTIPNYQNLK